jgi:uroporphyrin-III C-methyltransferase
MASRHLMKISRRLLEAGRRSDEPIAIISKATTPEQSVLVSTLGEIARARVDVQAPAVVVIGRVVGLRAALDWAGALAQQERGEPS